MGIGYDILYPEVPEIVINKRSLNDIDFPMTFRICAFELFDTVSRYQSFGYETYQEFFRGRSLFNNTLYGWAGHDEMGSILGNVEDVLDGVSFNWTEIVYQIRIYTGKLNEYYVNSEDIIWNKIPQYPACQILDVMEYFTEYKEEHVLQIFIDFNQVQDVGVSIFFEEKNKVLSRRLKTNMLSYDGPSSQYDDLFLPQDKKGIFSFHQNIYSEK